MVLLFIYRIHQILPYMYSTPSYYISMEKLKVIQGNAWICGLVRTLLYADFFYYYFQSCNNNMKLQLPA
ncbi:hypothetical protein ES332_D02G046600v1 [Gossypium tomentosum]|uniref:Uncharacterized protein n=1 Tax=Gossypium tomentosum TaxID=34277 RepID=A0A5D2LT76_GOSTO|nr:hypothetical protein ES332_D02G046600v1 [Gossypium tomentosum]